jgi:hypothetical protein
MNRKAYITILIALIATILYSISSCSTEKDIGGYWVSNEIVIDDTLHFPEVHEHYCDSVECKCVYVDAWSMRLVDTFYVKYWEEK